MSHLSFPSLPFPNTSSKRNNTLVSGFSSAMGRKRVRDPERIIGGEGGHSFPIAVRTNYHKLRVFKQHTFSVLHFSGSEIQVDLAGFSA